MDYQCSRCGVWLIYLDAFALPEDKTACWDCFKRLCAIRDSIALNFEPHHKPETPWAVLHDYLLDHGRDGDASYVKEFMLES